MNAVHERGVSLSVEDNIETTSFSNPRSSAAKASALASTGAQRIQALLEDIATSVVTVALQRAVELAKERANVAAAGARPRPREAAEMADCCCAGLAVVQAMLKPPQVECAGG